MESQALLVLLLFVLVLSIFLGFELINKVPSTLHTPLMSGANAISGITIVGALLASGGEGTFSSILVGTFAVFCLYKCCWRLFGNEQNVKNV